MSRTKKFALGVATLWPLLYLAAFFLFLTVSLFAIFSSESTALLPVDSFFSTVFILHILTTLWSFALLAIYFRLLFKSDRVPKDKKTLWALALFFGNVIAMPVFWYLYVWRDPAGDSPTD